MRPVIGITANFEYNGLEPSRLQSCLLAQYSDAVVAAGGVPLVLPVPPRHDAAMLDAMLAACDGLLLSGGRDIDPRRYGATEKHARTETLHPLHASFLFDLFARVEGRRTPTLAICLGHQIVHVARGGRLWQHVDDLELTPAIAHHLAIDDDAFHEVSVSPESRLASVLGNLRLETNSRHHQAVDPQHAGRGLRGVAFAPDGVLEASEDMDGRFLLTVQWHPEFLIDRPEQLALFETLVEEAGAHRAGTRVR